MSHFHTYIVYSLSDIKISLNMKNKNIFEPLILLRSTANIDISIIIIYNMHDL